MTSEEVGRVLTAAMDTDSRSNSDKNRIAAAAAAAAYYWLLLLFALVNERTTPGMEVTQVKEVSRLLTAGG